MAADDSTWSMEIDLEELRRFADILLRTVEENEGRKYILDEDDFWSVPPDALFDIAHEPNELDIGSLAWSHEFLSSMMQDIDDVLPYGLVWLAQILTALGLGASPVRPDD